MLKLRQHCFRSCWRPACRCRWTETQTHVRSYLSQSRLYFQVKSQVQVLDLEIVEEKILNTVMSDSSNFPFSVKTVVCPLTYIVYFVLMYLVSFFPEKLRILAFLLISLHFSSTILAGASLSLNISNIIVFQVTQNQGISLYS